MRRAYMRSLLAVGAVAVVAALYFAFLSTRTGRAYDGTTAEVVEAMLADIRADIEGRNWKRLGGYGVCSFLSWKNEAELAAYVEQDLGDGSPGPVDYFLRGEPTGIAPTEDGVRFVLVDSQTETTCTVVLKKSWGLWCVVDVSRIGATPVPGERN